METFFQNPIRVRSLIYNTLILSLLLVIFSSCSKETLEETEGDIATDAIIVSKDTPVAGKTYYLQNRKSGLHMDVEDKSNANGANVQQWGDASGTHRQWQLLSVGSGYYRLKGVDSGKSLTVLNGSNTNGANIESRAYSGVSHQEWQILSTGDGYYRIKSRDSGKSIGVEDGGTDNGDNVESRAWNGGTKFQWLFKEVGGDNGTPEPPSGGDSPADVLGITSDDWKLNGFSGSPSNDPDYVDDIPNLDTYENDNYFYTDGEWVFFKCYRGLGGSENSDNPRVELRELNGNGGLEYWENEGTNEMEFTVRVDQLSNNVDNDAGVVCVGQIHGPGSSVDDIIRVQFYGDAGQSSGNVRLKISGYITEEVMGSSQFIDNGYKLDTEYDMKITYNSDDYVRVYVNGSQIFSQKMDTDKDDNYFKVGNYIQESKGASFDGSNAIVRIKDLKITHN